MMLTSGILVSVCSTYIWPSVSVMTSPLTKLLPSSSAALRSWPRALRGFRPGRVTSEVKNWPLRGSPTAWKFCWQVLAEALAAVPSAQATATATQGVLVVHMFRIPCAWVSIAGRNAEAIRLPVPHPEGMRSS